LIGTQTPATAWPKGSEGFQSSYENLTIGLIAPPFIPVPPRTYGGTELFIAQLATALEEAGAKVIVYANGESQCRNRSAL
jgi:hypothetical protein